MINILNPESLALNLAFMNINLAAYFKKFN